MPQDYYGAPQFDYNPRGGSYSSARRRNRGYGSRRGGSFDDFEAGAARVAERIAAPEIQQQNEDFGRGVEDAGLGDYFAQQPQSGQRRQQREDPVETAMKAQRTREKMQAKAEASAFSALREAKARTGESAAFHKKDLKTFDEGPDGLELAQLQAGRQKDEQQAKETVGFLKGALTPGIEAGDPTADARAAQGRLSARNDRMEALAQKRARMEAQTAESAKLADAARRQYHAENDARLGLTNETYGRAAEEVNMFRARKGAAPIEQAPEVKPPAESDYQADDWVQRRIKKVNDERAALGRTDFIDPKTMGAYTKDAVKRLPDGGLDVAPTAIERAAVENAPRSGVKPDSLLSRALELGKLKASGVTHVGAQPIDRMIDRYGGEDAVDGARLVSTYQKAKGRLAEIEDMLPGMTDRARKPLMDERDVLTQVLSEKEQAVKSKGLWDEVRDPYWFEQAKGFALNAVKGAGSALVDTGESLARNAQRAGEALSNPGMAAARLAGVPIPDSGAQEKIAEFADAMRSEAEAWNWSIPDAVRRQLDESFVTGSVAQGVGSTAAFMAPAVVAGGIGKLAGLGERALGKLLTTTVATTGAASSGNSFRREAMNRLKPQLEAGEITKAEYDRSLGLAELAGSVLGTTEAVPVSRFARRIGEVPAGRTFLSKLLEITGKAGGKGTSVWMKGPGRKMLVDVVSEGLEEGGQEWVQAVLSDVAAKQIFDPNREIDWLGAAKNAAVGGFTGLLFSGVTNAMDAPKVAARYKELGDAVKRGAQKPDGGGEGSGSGVTPGTDGLPPSPSRPQMPADSTSSPESDVPDEVQADDELAAELGRNRAPAQPVGKPDYQYTVQRPQKVGEKTVPGYVQVDEFQGGKNTRSSNLAQLRSEGIDLPDVPDTLPQGRYTLAQIREAAQVAPVTPSIPIAQEPVAEPAARPTSGPAVKPLAPAATISQPPAAESDQPRAQSVTTPAPVPAATETISQPAKQATAQTIQQAQAPTQPAGTNSGKEPWQMTQEEWNAGTRFYRSGGTKNAQTPTGERVILKKESTEKTHATVSADFYQRLRRNAILTAIKQGKPVPAEIRAEAEQPSAPAFEGRQPVMDKSTPDGFKIPQPPAQPAAPRVPTTPASFVKTVTAAAKVRPGSRQHKFLADFSRRLHRAAPEAFGKMNVRVLSAKEWAADERLGTQTPDSRGAYDQASNTLYLHADRATPESITNTIVHEAGHFAEEFYLGKDFTSQEWAKLKDEQIVAAAKQYSARDNRSAAEIRKDPNARSEWVAMQFARVVRGDTQGMGAKLKAGLEKFLADVRALVTKWIGDERLTTEALDAKILEMLGYGEETISERPQSGAAISASSGESPAAPAPDTVPAVAKEVSAVEANPKPAKYADLIKRAKAAGIEVTAYMQTELQNGNAKVAGYVMKRTIAAEKAVAAPVAPAEPLAKPQSFRDTRTDLLVKINDALKTAPSEADFMRAAQEAAITRKPAFRRENDAQRREEADWVASHTRQLAAASTGNQTVTIQSGNSKFTVTNTKEVLGRLQKMVEKRIAPATNPAPREQGRGLSQSEMNGIKSGSVNLGTAEGRALLDLATEKQLAEMGLEDKYVRVGPGVVMPKEAADALRGLKEGKKDKFDVLGTPVDTNAILPPNDELTDPEAAQVTARTLRQAVRVASGVSGAVSAPQSGAIPSLADQEKALSEWADANGLMLDPVAFADEWRRQDKQGGAESQVYFDDSSQRVVKRNALLFNNDWVSFFRRILAHNRLFPDTAYLFHGFTPMDGTQPDVASKKVTLQAVLSQPVVKGEGATYDEIDKALVARGFKEGISGQYEDERFILDDLGENNVFKDADGNIRFIDPQVVGKPGVLLGTPAENTPEPVRKNEPVPGQPGYRFRSHPDTLINAGLDAIRQVYKVQGNEATVAAAKAFIENVKDENAAVAATMDYANTMPGAVRAAVKALIEQRLNKRRFDPKATPEERAQAKRAFDRLVEIMAERGTALGQEVQAYDFVNKLTPDGAVVAGNRNSKQRQEKMVGEAGVKAVEQLTDAMKAENERAIDEATTDLDRALRAVKVGKSIWQRYRDSAVARWISSIENANSAGPAELPPLLEFTNRLTREVQARIDDTLPKSEPRPQRTPAEIIREAVDNREKYREAWDAAREQLGTKYADRPDILDQLDEAMAGLMERPYSDKTIDRAIKEAHREMGLKVRDLARMHYRQADALGQTLAEKIAQQAGLKPEDAERLANLVKQRMVKLTADAKKKALARLIEGKTGASRRIFGTADRIIELSNLGAMTSDEYFQAIAKELKLPGMSEKQAERLRDLAEKAQSMSEGFQRDRVLTDLLTELQKVKGVGPLDVATAIYYAHILSGYTTQMVNALSTALNTAADIGVKVGRHPTTALQALRGIRDGSRTGFVQAMSILDTGYSHRAFDDKLPEVSPVLEMLAKDQERNVALRSYAKALRYISRAMRAMDAVFFQSANEAFQRITAARLAAEFEGGRLNWQERSQKVRELLAMSPAEFEAARNQAKAEKLTGFDYQLRVAELIHQRRAKDLNEGGVAFGREATFNQEPRGYLGVAAKAIRDASVKFPPLRLFVPFTNIVSNVANASLNYSPVGVVRAVKGYGGELAPQAEERDALLIKGIAGTTGLIWLLAYGLGDGDDDKMPWITGLGPQSTPARNQLRKTGWKPNTVKVGGAYYSYLETPLAIPLAIVGAYIDGLKYNGLGEKAAGERLARAVASVPETIVSMSFLRGLADFMDAARGRKSWGDIAGNVAAGVVAPNIVRQVDRTIDPTLYETDGALGTIAGQIPGIRQTFPKRIDVVGAPIESRPLERFGRPAVNDELWATLAQKQSWIPEAGKDTKLDKKPLTPEQYRAYVQQSGPAIEARLRANLPRLKLMTPEQADDFVQRVTREERAKVKPRLRAVPVFDVR